MNLCPAVHAVKPLPQIARDAPSVRADAVAREPQKDEFVVLLFTPSNR
jgi:hypothetical protein